MKSQSYSREQYVKAKDELDAILKVFKELTPDGIIYTTLSSTISNLEASIVNEISLPYSSKGASETTMDLKCPIFPIHIQSIHLDVGSYNEALFLSCHLTLQTYGFVCIVEVPSTVPGFAPALRGKVL